MKGIFGMNVYIASLPRSGTTLLGIMLNQHSQCMCIGESYYWSKFNPGESQCSCGSYNCWLLKDIYFEIYDDNSVTSFCNTCKNLDSYLFQNRENITGEMEFAQAEIGLSRLMGVYRKLTGCRIIVDTSTNVLMGESLLQYGYKIILLARDPRGILYSFKKADVRYKRNQSLSSYRKAFALFGESAVNLLDSSNVLLVRYEDLCNNPVDELKRICLFLDIAYEKKMFDLINLEHHLIMGNRIRNLRLLHLAEDTGWKNGLSASELEIITSNKKIVSLYKQFGYQF